MYKFMSMKTGELAPNLKYVIETMWKDLVHYHFLNINWKYNKKGW